MSEFPASIEELIFEFMDKCKFVFYPEQQFDLFLNCSKNEIFALLFVYRQKQVNMSEIAEYMNIPLNTVTGVVSRLEKKQLVLRERSEEDKRVVTISLTEDGKGFMEHEVMELGRYFSRVMEAFSEEEKKVLFGMADKIFAVLNRRDKPGEKPKPKKVRKIAIE